MIFREEPLEAINAVIFSMSKEAISEGSATLSVIENSELFGMGKCRTFVPGAIKHVILHIKSFSFVVVMFYIIFVVVFTCALSRLTNQEIQDFLLFFVHRIDNIFNSLVCHVFVLLIFFSFFFGLIFRFFRFGRRMKNDVCGIHSSVVVPNDSFEFRVFVISVSK